MAGPLTTLTRELGDVVVDPEVVHVAGGAAKQLADDVAGRVLGADRAMSGFKRTIPLRSGYDEVAGGLEFNLWPEGLWVLTDKGRRAKGYKVIPKLKRRGKRRSKQRASLRQMNGKRQGKRNDSNRVAISTPSGPRYSARITASKPLNTITDVDAKLTEVIFDAVDEHLVAALGQAG